MLTFNPIYNLYIIFRFPPRGGRRPARPRAARVPSASRLPPPVRVPSTRGPRPIVYYLQSIYNYDMTPTRSTRGTSSDTPKSQRFEGALESVYFSKARRISSGGGGQQAVFAHSM